MIQIIDENPTEYTNEYKQAIKSTIERAKHGLLNRSLNQPIKLKYDKILQKSDIKQEMMFSFDNMDLESSENIKQSDLSNVHIKKLILDFKELPIEKYDRAFTIAESYLDKCTMLVLTHCELNLYSPYFYKILEKASSVRELRINRLNVDTDAFYTTEEVLSNFENFSVFNLKNLKEVCFGLAQEDKTKTSFLSKVLRVFSNNESIRSNLESFKFSGWIFDSNQHVYDLLKAKSFGFLKCKLYQEHATGEYIELYEPKITKYDWRWILKYLLYNYAQFKNWEPITKLINVLDFYEFEDDYFRTRTIQMVKDFKNLKQYDFEKFKEFWHKLDLNDSILWDYWWSSLGFETEKLNNKSSSHSHIYLWS